MRWLLGLVVLSGCDLDLEGIDLSPQPAEMDVVLSAESDRTTEISGCWSRDFLCRNGGGPLVARSGPDEIHATFTLAVITAGGDEGGRYLATTDRFVPGAPIEITFDELIATIALPEAFELLAPAEGTVVTGASSIVRVAWTPGSGASATSVLASYRCATTSSTTTLVEPTQDLGTADVDLGVIASPGESCDVSLIVRHENRTSFAGGDGVDASLVVTARQDRRVAIRLTR